MACSWAPSRTWLPSSSPLIVAEVPFVDVVGTMLDDTLPLTVAEWDEWGDPRRPEDYAYLAGYSPYDNLPGPDRAALLVTASRHDPRVSVHEPAKWVARMRAVEAAEPARRRGPLLLRTALGGAAHTGPAGRYDAWRHEAFLHAFVLDQVGLGSVSPDVVATARPHPAGVDGALHLAVRELPLRTARVGHEQHQGRALVVLELDPDTGAVLAGHSVGDVGGQRDRAVLVPALLGAHM